jgi:hypothetical protein
MSASADSVERRIQVAGVLLIIGLVLEAICLLWARPISFVIFVAIGGLFLFAGVVVFLFSLVSTTRAHE